MNRNDAIYYAKRLVNKILELFNDDEDFKCMFASEPVNGKKQYEQIVDAYAEWCFPDDENENDSNTDCLTGEFK